MKKSKGILIFVLAFVMIFSLFGCAGNDESDQNAAEAPKGLLEEIQAKGTLTVAIEGETMGDQYFSKSLYQV